MGVDEDAPHVTGALAEFPNTVDNRVIRFVALQVSSLLSGSNTSAIRPQWLKGCDDMAG